MFSKSARLLSKWKKLPPKNIVIGSGAVTSSTFMQLEAVEKFHKMMKSKLESDIAEAGIGPNSELWGEFRSILVAYEAKIREIDRLRESFKGK